MEELGEAIAGVTKGRASGTRDTCGAHRGEIATPSCWCPTSPMYARHRVEQAVRLNLSSLPQARARGVDIDQNARYVREMFIEHTARPGLIDDPDFDRSTAGVFSAIDPRGPNPPARRGSRRASAVSTSATWARPELPVGLDFPTWTLLRDRAKEWMLPGIGTLEKDSVVAMQTNPTFIDAYLVGLNTQLHNELHWRNLPSTAGPPRC